jgi:hypothetical protein
VKNVGDTQKLSQKGIQIFENGQYALALHYFNEALRIVPNDVRIRELIKTCKTTANNAGNVIDWAIYYSGKDCTSSDSDIYRDIVNNACANIGKKRGLHTSSLRMVRSQTVESYEPPLAAPPRK